MSPRDTFMALAPHGAKPPIGPPDRKRGPVVGFWKRFVAILDWMIARDLNPSTRPKRSMISDERKGKQDAEEQAEHRADYRGSEAS
jgi:hypothetical protein